MTSIQKPTFQTAPLSGNQQEQGGSQGFTAPLGSTDMNMNLPELKVSRPLKVPSGVSSNTKQHVLLVRDCSSSMSGSKINELNLASSALVQELASPENKEGFLLSIIEFNTSASRSAFAASANTLNLPTATAGGGTSFDSALSETIRAVQEFTSRPNPDGWQYLRSQVLFLSDGQSSVSSHNIQALQEIADVTTIGYGSDADTGTLSRIASDGRVHVIGTNGGDLRKFLADVGQTLSQSLVAAR